MNYSPTICTTDPNLAATVTMEDGMEHYIVREECPECPDDYGDMFRGMGLYVTRWGYSTTLPDIEDATPESYYGTTVQDIARWHDVSVADVLNRYYSLTDQNKTAHSFEWTGYVQSSWGEGVIVVDLSEVNATPEQVEADLVPEYARMWQHYLSGDVYRLESGDGEDHDWQGIVDYTDDPDGMVRWIDDGDVAEVVSAY